jgi:glutamyl-tRNA reductase
LAKSRKRSLLFIDLALPRDIDPEVQELPGVYLYNLDQLSRIAKENLNRRAEEAAACESLVADHARSFGSWLERATVARVIRSAPRPAICRALLAGSSLAHC